MDTGFFDVYLPVAGMHFSILVLLLIGFSVGVLGGVFGVGGAWVVTPALNIFGFPMSYAIGTDLAHIFGKSIVASLKHGRMGNVDVKLGLISVVGSVIGVEAGARTIMWLTAMGLAGVVVRYAYIVLLFALGVYMVYDYVTHRRRLADPAGEDPPAPAEQAPRRRPFRGLPPLIYFPVSGVTVSLWTILGLFLLTGFLSGFLGVGGGFLIVPALIYLIGCPTVVAVGTSLFSVVFTGGYGCFTYALKGRVEVIAALIMLLGAAVGAQIGVTAVKYIHGYGIRLLFAVMILLAGLSVGLKQVEWTTAAAYVVMGAALGLCAVIILQLGRGYLKERAEKLAAPTAKSA